MCEVITEVQEYSTGNSDLQKTQMTTQTSVVEIDFQYSLSLPI